MGNKSKIPFTELFERTAVLAREDSLNVEAKFKGLINDVYTKQFPRQFDWRPLLRDSYIACTAYYNTGTVAISAAATTITGSSTVWTTAMTIANGWKIKFVGNPNIYDFEYTSATEAEITPALSGATDLSGASYYLFRDTYALASDFDRFLINGGLEYTIGGRPDVIRVTSEDTWKEDFQALPQARPSRMRVLGEEDASGYKQIQINPPPQTALVIPYDYIKKLAPMTEYTTGTITTLAAAGTTVTGSGSAFSSYIDDSLTRRYYFRVDRDGTGDESVWYLVDEDHASTSATKLYLTDTYDGTAIASGTETYTISMVPNLPAIFHDAIMYRAIMLAIADQDDPMYKLYGTLASDAITELKVLHKTRTYSKRPAVVIDRR